MADKELFDKIKAYMIEVMDEHIDPLTDETNTATLVEDAADKFGLYVKDKEGSIYPEDWLFDLAFYVYRDYCP